MAGRLGWSEQKTSGRRSPRRYLLSGLLRCGKCQHTLYSAAREDVRRYVCSSGPDHGGCGGTFVVAAPVEDLIAHAVLFRLDTPDLADALAGRAAADGPPAADVVGRRPQPALATKCRPSTRRRRRTT